jgi:hypothetical protein
MALVEIQLSAAVSANIEDAIIRAVADAVSSYAGENYADVKISFRQPLEGILPVPEDTIVQNQESSQRLVRADYVSFSTVKCSPSERRAYVDLRRKLIGPTMMAQPGYVSTMLLSLDNSAEDLMILNKWINAEYAEAYGSSDEHQSMKKLTLEVLGKPLQSKSVNVIHQDAISICTQRSENG